MSSQLIKNSNFINGQWVNHGSGKNLKVFEKYEHSLLSEIPFANEEQVELAIVSAQKGFKAMKNWSAGERAEKLQKLFALIQENKQLLIDLIIKEAGKPQFFAKAEVERSLATLDGAIRETLRFGGEMVPLDYGAGVGKTAFTKRFPVGVVLCVTPFNFPLNLLMHKVAPAFALGCSVIIKPPPQAPLSALALTALIEKVGYPDGAVNLVNCEVSLAEKLVRDDRIAMLSFTGSAKVGWYLKNICGKKKVALELGGNAAVIVDEIDHLPNAAKTIALGAFLYAGQICISTQRIFVNEKIYDKFLNLYLEEIRQLKCGDPKQTETIVGPVIDKSNFLRIQDWIDESLKMGAKKLTSGFSDESHHLIAPTLLTNTNKSMRVVNEEIFGPVATIEKYKTFNEAIQLSNDSQYGLQAGVFTNQIQLMKLAHDELEVGGVIINNIPGFRIDTMPYGGVKNSGFGREGIRYTMEEMSEPRLIVY